MPPERAPISFGDKDGQLNVVMQEYSAIRGEVLTTLGSQVGTLSFGAATVGLLVAAAATLWKDEGVIAGLILLFGVPLVCFLTLAIHGGEFVRLTRAGLFLRCLECDLNRAFRLQLLSGGQNSGSGRNSDGDESSPIVLLCWEHWSDIRHQGRDVDRLNRIAIWLVFFSLAAGFGIVGCVRLITSGLPWHLTVAITLGGVVVAFVASWWLVCLRRFALDYRALYAQCSQWLVFELFEWLNLVEVWFRIIEHQALHRADVASVAGLNKKIRAFVIGWNDRCHPFMWTKTSTEVLKKANRPTTLSTGH